MNTRISLKFDKRLFGDMLRYGFKAYIAAFFAFLVIRSDMLLVNYYIGTEGAGLYSLAVNLTDWLLLVPATIAAMLFPKASSIGDARSELTKKVSRHTVVLMGGICLVAAIFAHPVITLAYGGAFKDSVAPFLFLLPGIFFLSLQTLYMQDFAARGMPPIVYISPALGFVVNIGLNLIMIPKYGIVGASVASSCAYFLMFTINFIYFIKVANAHSREVLILNKNDLFEFWAIWRNKAQAIISK
jgi:O-antigen/teichoic acid export membrane protein